MMRKRPLLLSVLALLHGCAQLSPDPDRPDAPANEAAQPLAPPLGWETLDNIHFAAFSAARPGDYKVMAVCAAQGRVTFHYVARPDAPRDGPLTLMSGRLSASFPAQVEERRITPPPAGPGPGALTGLEVRATAPIDHPVLARFFETGILSVAWGNERLRLDARREILPALERELRTCPVPGR
jgi:hypothetical protein